MKTPLAARIIALVVFAALPRALDAADAANLLPNPDFTQGGEKPDGWTLSGGQGQWVDRRILEVTGAGKDSNCWRCDCRFEPGGFYRFQMRARRLGGGSGCVISGPAFANRDQQTAGDWKSYDYVFRVPDGVETSDVRLGQWESTGKVQFDAARLAPVLPVYREVDRIVLGDGESIRGGTYTFTGVFDHEGSNHHRPLHRVTAEFNSNRWVFHNGAEVVYRFDLPGRLSGPGRVALNVCYHVRGACIAEISSDGKTWKPVATQDKIGAAEAPVPADAVSPGPHSTIFLRLSGSPNAYFQVDRVEFSAPLQGTPTDRVGETLYADVDRTLEGLTVERIALADERSGRGRSVQVAVGNPTKGKRDVTLTAASKRPDGSTQTLPSATASVPPGGRSTFDVAIPLREPGEHEVLLTLAAADAPGQSAQLTLRCSVPRYYRADYGRRLALGGAAGIWWCDATRKIPRQRPAPEAASNAVELSAARNDREAAQVVLRPEKPLKRLTVAAGPLRGPDGAAIPAENVTILRVAYHYVEHPTDATGVRDWWPDALPPLGKPIDVATGENQPLWVLVRVPGDAKPGDYTGEIALAAEGFAARVPLKLHVWDFALPERNHIETAFGLSPWNVFRYHQLKSDEDKRRVLDMYFENFAEHRISPYNPTPLDPIRVKFTPEGRPPGAEVDFSAFDPALQRAIERFHFTNFMLPIEGMGGGTFHERYPPKIGRFTEETPEYQAMFGGYVKQLEDHFRQKGWLAMPYIYWFDEPDPKDYAFVRGGFERLKKYAPGLTTMLTEQPEEALAGPVDIWCPVSPNYDPAAAKRRPAGERFWWYVCCGPKAPYCTLFIDHPATELRVWLWQTWQRGISGILVWESNYWTSSAAFPDPKHPQNPYEDPMGYVSGYSTPEGVKHYWGNGDGRFIYPPEVAATPGVAGPEPVIEPPVSSIRWEMLREGIEDWEMLHLLRELVEKRRANLPPDQLKRYESLLAVPESITKSMTEFTTDPAPIYERRAAVATAIEELTSK